MLRDYDGPARVIVGYDGSAEADAALRYGVADALGRGADLVLVNAVDDMVLGSAWGVVFDVETIRDLTGEDGRETVERFADAADVRAAVGKLPDHERVVIEMAYFEDLTQQEIATRLDLPLGTVKARASRGTRRLATLMRAEEGDAR